MALQLAYDNTDTGDSYDTAYHRITQVQITALSHAGVIVSTYKDAAARNDDKQPVRTVGYTADAGQFTAYFGNSALDESNPFKQGYLYLKTLADFTGAEDV